jgi:hypothetical protein
MMTKVTDTKLDLERDLWNYPDGLIGSFKKVMDEYVEFRNIKPFRLILYGVDEIYEQFEIKKKMKETL